MARLQTGIGSDEAKQDLYKRIGIRIKEAREQQRLKQDQLGELIEESSVAVSRWETATRKPTIEDLEKVGQALGKSLLYFVEETPSDNSFVGSLLRLNGKLTERDKEELIALAEHKAKYFVTEMLEK
jgi:transcriptional regulator with XRE-family HTH domain